VKYVVTVAGKAFDVVLNGGEVAVNDRQVSAELIAVPQTPVRELVLDGKTRKYAMTPESDGWSVLPGRMRCKPYSRPCPVRPTVAAKGGGRSIRSGWRWFGRARGHEDGKRDQGTG